MTNDDSRLVMEIRRVLHNQRNMLQRKNERYAAIHRNFQILKQVSRQQQLDFHHAMAICIKTKEDYDLVCAEFDSHVAEYNKLEKAYKEIKLMEKQFEEVISKKLEMKTKIDTLTAVNNRLTVEVEQLEATQNVQQ